MDSLVKECCAVKKKERFWVRFKGGNIWAPPIRLGDISPEDTMDVVMWIIHCLLSDSPSLTLCYPTTHLLHYYWKKHRVNQRIPNSFCFQKHPTSAIFVWPWPALPGRWDSTLSKNNWWDRRWRDACPRTWLPKLVGLTEHVSQSSFFSLFIHCRLVGIIAGLGKKHKATTTLVVCQKIWSDPLSAIFLCREAEIRSSTVQDIWWNILIR